MGKGYALVEGHGEVRAAGNLLARLSREIGLPSPWDVPIRWKNLHQRRGVERGAQFIRAKGDADALLLLRDEDDACPRDRGPEIARWLREQRLPFPSAVVLLHPEYEVLFLPCIPQMAGRRLGSGALARPGLRPDAEWEGDWERKRGIKEWLTGQLPAGRSYKPTTDQLLFTQMMDLPTLRAAAVPCFGTLENALRFLRDQVDGGGNEVYP